MDFFLYCRLEVVIRGLGGESKGSFDLFGELIFFTIFIYFSYSFPLFS